MTAVILTVVGSDRPGLTERLADAVLAAGGNWLGSNLARLGGHYVGAVLVELPDAAVARLEAAVRAVDADGLTVTLVAASNEPDARGNRLALELVGQDRPGIVREVSAALAAIDVNIEAFESSAENGSWSGERLFRAEAELRLPDGCSEERVREALEHISGDIMVDFKLSPEPA